MEVISMLKAGDTVTFAGHGTGIIKKVDNANERFFYLCDFRGEGGNGSLVWLPKEKVETQNMK